MATKKKSASEQEAKKSFVLSLMKEVDKNRGARRIELRVRDQADYVSTGCLTLDLIMGGGFFAGRFLQLYGKQGSGKSTAVYSAAGILQKKGTPVIFFDHEATTDAKYIEKLGMDLHDTGSLAYYKPDDGVQTYSMIFELLQKLDDMDYGPPQVCFMIDSIATMPTKGEMEDWEKNKRMAARAAMHSEWLTRIKTLVSKKNATLVAVNQIRANPSPYAAPEARPGGNAWEFFTDNLVKVNRGKAVEVNGEQYQPMKFKTEKNKNFMANQEAEVFLHLGHGIDPAGDALEFMRLTGTLTKDGKLPLVTGIAKYEPWFLAKKVEVEKARKAKDQAALDLLATEMDAFIGTIDKKYKSSAALEDAIRASAVAGSGIYQACWSFLTSGDALTYYMARKKGGSTPEAVETEDVAEDEEVVPEAVNAD